MADGMFPPPRLHDVGIYLDLPMLDYVNDPAISGSGLKKLLSSPADFKWELPAIRNPLFKAADTDAKALGTLVHKAVLEGMAAFHDCYFVAPELDDEDPRVIRTADHAKNWLKDNGLKCTGLKAELFERVQGHWDAQKLTGAVADDEGPIFMDALLAELSAQGNGQREKIKQREFEYVSLVERVVRKWPEANALISDGLPEVSIFWVEDGVRFKARFDWIAPSVLCDLKKFGQPPQSGRSLRAHLAREVATYRYDIQAVHNFRAAMQIPLLMRGGGIVSAIGDDASARIAKLQQIGDAYLESPPEFKWLFLRTPGPPQGLILPLPCDSRRWEHCELDIRDAIDRLHAFRKAWGDELDADKPWIDVAVEEWDDDDLPEFYWGAPR